MASMLSSLGKPRAIVYHKLSEVEPLQGLAMSEAHNCGDVHIFKTQVGCMDLEVVVANDELMVKYCEGLDDFYKCVVRSLRDAVPNHRCERARRVTNDTQEHGDVRA